MKVLISRKTGLYYYYKEEGDYSCKEGILKEEDLKSGKSSLTTNTGREFLVFNSNGFDKAQKIKRGPQILLPKDLGYILSRTGIDKNAFVVEGGSGSGAAACFFAKFVEKVHSYEIVEEHHKLSKRNAEYLELDNVEFFLGDMKDSIEKEKDVDLLFIDSPEPIPILEKDLSGIKSGRYIVCYLPSINQITDLFKFSSESKEDLYIEEVTEVILRHWKISNRVSRPEHKKEIDHTAFLVFIRKI